MISQTFNLKDWHVATIKSTAKDNGDTSDSAALRNILDKFTRAGAVVHTWHQGQVTDKEALDSLGVLFLGAAQPQPRPPAAGGNGGKEAI